MVYQQMLAAGGKRLRPLLTLLSCEATGGNSQQAINWAVAVEVLHLASLIHDDVIDEADERRGQPAARQVWGNRVTILVGDFLVAEVFRQMANELGWQALASLARAVAEMSRAELSRQPGDQEEDEEGYLGSIGGKTGALMAAACEVGALAAKSEAAIPLLRFLGQRLGEAFQITDDLLDLYGNPELLGKPVLQDLQEGYWSLPIIHALRTARPAEVAALRQELAAAHNDPVAARRAADMAAELGGRRHAQDLAEAMIAQAHNALAGLPPSPARASLIALAGLCRGTGLLVHL